MPSQPTTPNAPGSFSDPCYDCYGQETHAPGCEDSTHPGSSYSAQPVRYSNGEVFLVTEDLSFKSFGIDWGHTRSYSNLVTVPAEGRNGNSWFVKEWPYLSPSNLNAQDPNAPGTICLVWLINDALWFDLVNGSYVARFQVKPKLSYDAAGQQFTLTDSEGRVTKFFDFSTSVPEPKRGRFKSFTDAAGRETVADYNTDNLIKSFVQAAETQTSGYQYVYETTGVNAGRLKEVRYELNGVTVRRVAYTYYTGADAHGSAGDLEKATVWKAGQTPEISNTYYRYYKAGDANGVVHGLRFVLSPLGYRRMVDKFITPETATDQQIADFAKHEFRYNADRSVRQETVNAGTSTYGFTITQSSFADGFNNWKRKTLENLPDGNRRLVYTNYAGQAILKVFIVMSAGQETSQRWYEYYQYDDAGRILLKAESSAVLSYNEAVAGLVTLKGSQGLIRLNEYYPASPGTGGAPNRLRYEMVKEGAGGSPVKIKEWQYVAKTVGSTTIYLPWKEIEFRSAANGGSDPVTTEYSYTAWQHLRVTRKTIILPVVPVSENGSGVADQAMEAYDAYGRMTWRKDERGYITGYSYDPATDGLVERIDDVASGAPWSALPNVTHLNLVTNYTVDDEGRTVQELGPVHEIDPRSVDPAAQPTAAIAVRRAHWTIHLDNTFQRWEGAGYQLVASGAFKLINPVQIKRYDEAMRLIDEIQAVREDAAGQELTDGPLTSGNTFAQSSWVRWTRNNYERFADVANQRVYFDIPATGAGVRDTNYNQTDYQYDILHHPVRERSPGGTITRYVFHPRGWVLSKWIGTNDAGANNTDPSGGGAAGNNMVLVGSYEYDGGLSGGDGTLTKLTQHVDDSQTRVTAYGYDFRNRRTSTDGEIDFYEAYTVDNLGRLTQTDRRNTSASGTLVARSAQRYDTRRRIYERARYSVDPANGAVGNALLDRSWFDASGNVIKQQPAGSQAFTKSVYNGVNRATTIYLAVDAAETSYVDAGNVADDTVLEQTELRYDAAGNTIEQVRKERFHDATELGPLNSPAATPKARVTYDEVWPDPLGRSWTKANYGTDHGATLTRPPLAPPRSASVLVTSATYTKRGEEERTSDAAGRINETLFDDAGRRTKTTENAISGGTAPDQNKTTLFAYTADGALARLTAKNSVTGDQVTQWIYGTTRPDSGVASSLLVRAKKYPDSTTDQVTFAYNRLGEMVRTTDQRQTTRQHDLDKLGRLLHDRVTQLGQGVDATVRRISWLYDVRGLATSIASYASETAGVGTPLNEVRNTFDNFEQVALQYQSHTGAVDETTTPRVGYGYRDGTNNTARLESITYPNGRVINRAFGNGGVDDQLGRVSALVDGSTTNLAEYQYVGAGRFATVTYPQPGLALTYVKQGSEQPTDGGDQYTGWDRFGRIIDQRWLKASTGAAVERLQYGYDAISNRLYRRNVVATSGQDELYAYDALNQLQRLQRGTLNTARDALTGTPTWEENFTFDPTGNWGRYVTSGTATLDQARTHNEANEILTISGSSQNVAYDLAGNMTRAPKPDNWSSAYDSKWDAWNRLVKVLDGAATVVTYAYDGLTRRITSTDAASIARHYYYSENWQILEERLGSATTPDRQFVWGLRRLDDLVLRDRTLQSGNERFYSLDDPLNVTAIADATGTIAERYGYSAFGMTRVTNASFSPQTSSSVGWETRFGGYRFDQETQLYQVRFRYHHSNLGRWLSRDLLGESEPQEGINPFHYNHNRPIGTEDPLGLKCILWDSKAEHVNCGPTTSTNTTTQLCYSVGPTWKGEDGVTHGLVCCYTKFWVREIVWWELWRVDTYWCFGPPCYFPTKNIERTLVVPCTQYALPPKQTGSSFTCFNV